ncbi:hypothetical protein [Pelosinus sp. sgz500959]|uniref:hypothetical protein n=1 Tax=Pelosinus sp. sgz500959 TaxID=3242472 RepID=UPI003671BA5C
MNLRQSCSKEIMYLISEMENGKISYGNSKKAIEGIEKNYEKPFFITQFTPKQKPWDRRYLKKMTDSARYGVSKEDLLHIAEVSADVYRWRHRLKSAGRILLWAVGVITAGWCLFLLLGKIWG